MEEALRQLSEVRGELVGSIKRELSSRHQKQEKDIGDQLFEEEADTCRDRCSIRGGDVGRESKTTGGDVYFK